VSNSDEQPHQTRWRRYRALLLNTGLFLVVFFAVTTFQSRNMLAADGHAAPGLRGTTLAGEPYDLADARSRPVLVYFFAPWCKVCAASADNLVRLRRWRGEADLEMVAVALDWSGVEDVRAYAERHDLDMTVLLGDASIARRWQVYGFPSYYVLDSEHRVARSDVGYSSQFGLWWRAWMVD
jgi:peroxiredoxin